MNSGTSSGAVNQEVEDWFSNTDHPQKETMLMARAVILKADPRIKECIKWSTPTFMYKGNLASFQPNAKKFASLMFHRGSEIPGKHPELLGDARLARTMRFADVDDVAAKDSALRAVVKAWCNFQDG